MTDEELQERMNHATEKMNPLQVALLAAKAMYDVSITANHQADMVHKTVLYMAEKAKARHEDESENARE